MSDERMRCVWPAVAGLVISLVLYVASFGPAWAVCFHSSDQRSGWFVVYAPLVSICKYSKPIDDALSKYSNWWDERLYSGKTMEE